MHILRLQSPLSLLANATIFFGGRATRGSTQSRLTGVSGIESGLELADTLPRFLVTRLC